MYEFANIYQKKVILTHNGTGTRCAGDTLLEKWAPLRPFTSLKRIGSYNCKLRLSLGYRGCNVKKAQCR